MRCRCMGTMWLLLATRRSRLTNITQVLDTSIYISVYFSTCSDARPTMPGGWMAVVGDLQAAKFKADNSTSPWLVRLCKQLQTPAFLLKLWNIQLPVPAPGLSLSLLFLLRYEMLNKMFVVSCPMLGDISCSCISLHPHHQHRYGEGRCRERGSDKMARRNIGFHFPFISYLWRLPNNKKR